MKTSGGDTVKSAICEPAFLKTLVTTLFAHPKTCDVMTKFTHDVMEASMNKFESKIMAPLDKRRENVTKTAVNVR